ncbi:MAG: FAD binding domain-containing protein, partial [Chloroflexota bacterium]
MNTPSFEYASPATLDEAVALLSRNPTARPLAGGQSLVVDLKFNRKSPALLVDLRRLGALKAISLPAHAADPEPAQAAAKATMVIDLSGSNAGLPGITIGALATCSEIAEHTRILTRYTALADAARSVGDPQVRNMSTLGGALAQNDPAGDLPAAVMALGGTIQV